MLGIVGRAHQIPLEFAIPRRNAPVRVNDCETAAAGI
jgi:predicted Co/Zn/Cd cation transporter (cation efflux family)